MIDKKIGNAKKALINILFGNLCSKSEGSATSLNNLLMYSTFTFLMDNIIFIPIMLFSYCLLCIFI